MASSQRAMAAARVSWRAEADASDEPDHLRYLEESWSTDFRTAARSNSPSKFEEPYGREIIFFVEGGFIGGPKREGGVGQIFPPHPASIKQKRQDK